METKASVTVFDLCPRASIFLHILCVLIFQRPLVSFAQVATAPFSPDQRLINPAAATTRPFRGVAVNYNHAGETSQNSDASVYSQYKADTQVDTLSINAAWKAERFFIETNILPQKGQRTTTSSTSGTNSYDPNYSSNVTRDLALVPLQLMVGAPLIKYVNLGGKVIYTHASFATDDEVGSGTTDYFQKSKSQGTRVAGLLVTSLGGTLEILDTGIIFGGSVEFLRLSNDVNSQVETTTYTGGDSRVVTTYELNTDTRQARKNILGLGYVRQLAGGNILRLDLSYEQMPQMTLLTEVPDGVLYRFLGEVKWSFFHLGTEVTSQSGYYIDPYNMIPYYFGTGNFTGESTVTYGFFGGFKSAKGHSVGISFSQSQNAMNESLSLYDTQKIPLNKNRMTYSLSYTYLF